MVCRPISIVLEGQNFSVSMELDEFEKEVVPGGGIIFTRQGEGISAEVCLYEERRFEKFGDEEFNVKLVFENGDIAEFTY